MFFCFSFLCVFWAQEGLENDPEPRGGVLTKFGPERSHLDPVQAIFYRFRGSALRQPRKKWGPRNYTNGSELGPGGSVWAETLSKRRPEAQDHFPGPAWPKIPNKKQKP